MYVIGVYDISTIDPMGKKRIPKIMKTLRKYLHHTQKSVFEGEITEAKFMALKKEIESIINKNQDYVLFFRVENKNNIKKENIGIEFDACANII